MQCNREFEQKENIAVCVWHYLGMEMLFLICPVGAVGRLSAKAMPRLQYVRKNEGIKENLRSLLLGVRQHGFKS